MDEKTPQIIEYPFPEEVITEESYLFRLVNTQNGTVKIDGRRFPNETAFRLRENEKGLSLNWDKYCCEKKSLYVVGLSKSEYNDQFINVSPRAVFKLPAKLLKTFGDLRHTPVYYGSPSPVGFPNNISHSESFPESELIALKMQVELSDYCRNNEQSQCKVDMKSILKEIEALRERLNDTPFHRNWDFN